MKIATEDCPRVIETAAEIRQALDQEGVGIEFRSRYYRYTQAAPGDRWLGPGRQRQVTVSRVSLLTLPSALQ